MNITSASPKRVHKLEGQVLDTPTDSTKPIAIIAYHGMGQQVHFETIDQVTQTLVRQFQNDSQHQNKTINVITELVYKHDEQQPGGNKRYPRAIIEVEGAKKVEQEIHIYEAYWAPLTAGRVSAWDVTKFLFEAAYQGLFFSLGGHFPRWLFGSLQRHRVPSMTRPALLATLFVVVAILFHYFSFIVTLFLNVLLLLRGIFFAAHSHSVIDALTQTLFFSPLLLGAIVVPALLLRNVYLARQSEWDMLREKDGDTSGAKEDGDTTGARTQEKQTQETAKKTDALLVKKGLLWLGIILVLAWLFWSFFALATQLLNLYPLGSVAYPYEASSTAFSSIPGILLLPFWLFAGLALYLGRKFFIEYFGDVTAYVSAHKVSEFKEIREGIQQAGFDICSFVYSMRQGEAESNGTTEPEVLLYDEIIIVAHSLGSLVAYDSLNAVINRDLATSQLDACKRTKLLLTFGSPLDKTAFIFRTYLKGAIVREALAATVQPLIMWPEKRPRWVNIYSQPDWISGSLEFYDEAEAPSAGNRIINLHDDEGFIPLLAHTQYWKHTLLPKTLYEALKPKADFEKYLENPLTPNASAQAAPAPQSPR